jgi:CheY-like chemotaxis protein
MSAIKNTYIIDDDSSFTYIIKLQLKGLGKFGKILTYKNGQEGIRSLTKQVNANEAIPEVIFLDLNMPIMDGWEFLDDFVKFSNKVRQRISLYIVSSSIDPRDLERIHKLDNVKGYILKPITVDDLNSVINKIT